MIEAKEGFEILSTKGRRENEVENEIKREKETYSITYSITVG